jgi:hypothetical protein
MRLLNIKYINVGSRITGEGLVGNPLTSSQCEKQDAFKVLANNLRTDKEGVAMWNGYKLVDSQGRACIAPTVFEGNIS